MIFRTLSHHAADILGTGDPHAKAAETLRIADAWQAGSITEIGTTAPPGRPARPATPVLLPPRMMPKRRALATTRGRVALLHALAHIELNAIDLAWDIVCRFSAENLPAEFYRDWVWVARDEARHFSMLTTQLTAFGSHYGALPAHDGLWEAAECTSHDLLSRLAIVPLVLEARGLDVTPDMINRLQRAGDSESAGIISVIHREEIRHVAAGIRWFHFLCDRRGLVPRNTWRLLVKTHFKGHLSPPYNHHSRFLAGFPKDYYE